MAFHPDRMPAWFRDRCIRHRGRVLVKSIVRRPAKRNALYNSVPIRSTTGDAMAEPTYEELKAKLAEMEKQGGGRPSGSLEVRVGEKRGGGVYGLGGRSLHRRH